MLERSQSPSIRHQFFHEGIKRVQECVLFIKFNVKTPIPYPFYVRRTMKVVSWPWNMRVGSHRGPERAFWAFFHHFWQFLTVFGLIIRFKQIFLGLNSLCVCTYVLHRQILQYLKKTTRKGPTEALNEHFGHFLGIFDSFWANMSILANFSLLK